MEAGGVEHRAERLRDRARDHPTTRKLKATLPPLEKHRTVPPAGLYQDPRPRPSTVGQAELRLPVLRVVSSDGDRTRLLGRLLAVTHLDDPLERWGLRMALHVPTLSSSVEMEDETGWFLRILEMHYQYSQDRVRFGELVEA